MSILKFIKSNKLKFMAVNTFLNKNTKKKAYQGIVTKAHYNIDPKIPWSWESDLSYSECLEFYESKERKTLYPKMIENQCMIYASPEFLIIDSDSQEAYDTIKKILKKSKLYSKKAITESFNGRVGRLDYKKHFWFKIESPKEFLPYRGITNGTGWDLIHYSGSKIAEFIDTDLDSANIHTLNIDDFTKIYQTLSMACPVTGLPKVEIVKEKKKKVTKEDIETVKSSLSSSVDPNLTKILDSLKSSRFDNYKSWFTMACIFVNENLELSIFDEYSKKYDGYNKENNNTIISKITINDSGYRLSTLYYWLKEDNIKVFDELKKTRMDSWQTITRDNDYDWAMLYYNRYPDEYAISRAKNQQFYRYNSNNVLVHVGDKFPAELTNNMSELFRDFLNESLSSVDVESENYLVISNLIKKTFNHVSTVNFIEKIQKYLIKHYRQDDLEDVINKNNDLIAFDNCLYDHSISNFRPIKKTDYVTITTGYCINPKSIPERRKQVVEFLWSIWENQQMVDYWSTITALGLFTTNFQSIFFHSGTGGNGKGKLSEVQKRMLGAYMYGAEYTFLSDTIKNGAANPTLSQCAYVRNLLVAEPDEKNTKETDLNISLVKTLSGGDLITCRGLFKDNMSYVPMFNVHVQCNTKPKLPKVDDAIKRRIKIIIYPFNFVDDPVKPTDRLRNYDISDMIKEQEFINELFLYLMDYAKMYKNMSISKIPVPKEVTDEINDYLDDNNPVKNWLSRCIMITGKDKDRERSSEILQMYNDDPENNVKMTPKTMIEAMRYNGVLTKKNGDGIMVYYGIKKIEIKEEETNQYKFL